MQDIIKLYFKVYFLREFTDNFNYDYWKNEISYILNSIYKLHSKIDCFLKSTEFFRKYNAKSLSKEEKKNLNFNIIDLLLKIYYLKLNTKNFDYVKWRDNVFKIVENIHILHFKINNKLELTRFFNLYGRELINVGKDKMKDILNKVIKEFIEVLK